MGRMEDEFQRKAEMKTTPRLVAIVIAATVFVFALGSVGISAYLYYIRGKTKNEIVRVLPISETASAPFEREFPDNQPLEVMSNPKVQEQDARISKLNVELKRTAEKVRELEEKLDDLDLRNKMAKPDLFAVAKDVRVTIISAYIDNAVVVPKTKGRAAPRIVTKLEILFPIDATPESITELTLRDDEEKQVDVYWGHNEPLRADIDDRAMIKLIVRECFFPIDFKQGKLWGKSKYLCYFKMPPVPYNAPNAK